MGRYGSRSRGRTSYQSRQSRRAQIYERRAKQVFVHKLLGFCAVCAVFALFLCVRFLSVSENRDMPVNDPGEGVAGVKRVASAPVSSLAAASPLSGNIPVIDNTQPLYQVKADLQKSADFRSFFEGYEVLTTPDTVKLRPNRMSVENFLTGTDENRQGGAEHASDYLDSSTDDENVFLDSESAILVNLDTGEVVAARTPDEQIYPASMTTVLTLLVANEQMEDRTGTFTITQDITDHVWQNDLSAVCWSIGEAVTVEDMEYGTILPSGADAAIGLARYAAGSEEKLVELMNNKIKEMGLSDGAHFTNVTGMHEEDEHCTVTDMAMIMKAAVEYQHTLDVMRTGEYRTSHTLQHPEGVYFFNLFLDRTQVAEAEGTLKGNVICAKTGFTNESRNCAVTYYISASGAHYVCVTAKGSGSRRVVQDHINLYNTYAR